ncbi:MAG: pyrroline-5-carboxylate reductase [Oscillospiraceae bacterium]|nr:pyrroline-5-carboxylate reductase [Oscillospiraceae bacterium]
MKTIAFIGTGAMGGALATAVSRADDISLLLANRHPEKAELLALMIGGTVTDNETAVKEADILFLAVKPQQTEEVLTSLKPVFSTRENRLLLVSTVAGTPIARLQELIGLKLPIIHIMPNIPVSVGEGMVFYACGEEVLPEEQSEFCRIMAGAGRLAPLPESHLDMGSAVAGCGPAFAAMFAEAIADGGVIAGLPRAEAMEFAFQMLIGTGKYLLQSGMHPGQLKDAVCSPAGATIQGVRILEENGFRGAVIDAVVAAYRAHLGLGA